MLYGGLALSLPAIHDPELAVWHCRDYNDWIAEFCAANPRRLHAAAALPLQDPAAAVAEARRARALGLCAGFTRLATAVFRSHGVPARCSAGFAAYFSPTLEDHWVCEYWDGATWRLLDAQLGEHTARDPGIRFSPIDVPRDQFLDASTAWRRMRAGEIDPSTMGL